MGNRAVIAATYPDGVKGRYVHWDGYPSGVGLAVLAIVQRDGWRAPPTPCSRRTTAGPR